MSDLIDTRVESGSDDPDYLVTWVTFLVGQVGLIRKLNVSRFAKTRHNEHIFGNPDFASVDSIYLKLCSVTISTLYCKYFLSYKAR